MKKEGIIFFIFALCLLFLILFISSQGSDSSSTSEWLMFGRTLGHSFWDGQNFTVIPNLNNANFTTPFNPLASIPSPSIISNGYVYVGADNLYQLNASNVSQQIANYSAVCSSSPVIANGFLYFGSNGLYQLNASNVSQQIANYSGGIDTFDSPAVSNGYVYVGDSVNFNFYQLNASNISQMVNSFSTGGKTFSSPAVSNGYVYFTVSSSLKGAVKYIIYQLNASNVSQQIANYLIPLYTVPSSPAVSNGYVYVGADNLYQLNASNVSQQIANYSSGASLSYSPAVSNGYVYIGDYNDFYQLNASNVSQQIANISGFSTSSPAVSNGYVYFSSDNGPYEIYQLNASNVSQQIANYTTTGHGNSISIGGGYVYAGVLNIMFGGDTIYQLNASNISLQNPCFESWGCSAWSDCSGGIQTRTCTDANACGTTAGKPAETQTCSTGGHVAPPQSPSGGGGGGSVTISKPIMNVAPSEPVQITLNNTKMDLTGITLILKKSVENASMNITKVDQTEFLLFGLPIGKLYQLFQIEPLGIQYNDILNATLDFKINKTFLAENNITFHHKANRYWLLQNDIVGNIAVYRMPTGTSSWAPLITNYTGEDDNAYYFKSSTPGFSTFAIFFNKYDCLPNSARCADNNVQLCLGNATWLVTDHCSDTCDNGKCTVSFYKSGQFKFLIGTILTGIFAIVLIRVIHNRRAKNGLSRKQRKEIRKNKRKIRREMKRKR